MVLLTRVVVRNTLERGRIHRIRATRGGSS